MVDKLFGWPASVDLFPPMALVVSDGLGTVSVHYEPTGGGHAQKAYKVDSEPAGSDLYVEVRFMTDACEVWRADAGGFHRVRWVQAELFQHD